MKTLCLALAAVALCASTASAQTVQVLAPNGGEQMCLGQTFQIRWLVTGYTGTIRLVLFKSGQKVEVIAEPPVSPNAYTWNVGQTAAGMALPGNTYTIRAVITNALDYSDAPFTIKAAGECNVGPSPSPTPNSSPSSTPDLGILQKIREMRAVRVKIPGPGPDPCRCPEFDLGSLLDLVSNPTWSPRLTFTVRLLKNGQPIATLGTLGKGQALPRNAKPKLNEKDFALFQSSRGGAFQIGIFGANGALQHQIALTQ